MSALPSTSCVTSSRLPMLSELQFPRLERRNTYLQGPRQESNQTMQVGWSARCEARSQHSVSATAGHHASITLQSYTHSPPHAWGWPPSHNAVEGAATPFGPFSAPADLAGSGRHGCRVRLEQAFGT